MRLWLDQGLPRSTVLYLRNCGIEAVHVATEEGMVVVTLDADFHTLLPLCGIGP